MVGKYSKRHFLTFVSSVTCLLKSVHDPVRSSSFYCSIPTAINIINNISLKAIFKFIVCSIICEFSKQGWICSFVDIIIWYLFSVLKVVFNRVIMFLISDLNDITYKANKVIKYLQRRKCAKKMSCLFFCFSSLRDY